MSVYIVSILMHELGHVASLGHTPYNSAIMYYAASPDITSLTTHEIDALDTLYEDHTSH